MITLYFIFAAAIAIPTEVNPVARAISAREAISSGTVQLRQLWEHAGDFSEYRATASFDRTNYRLDIHEGTALKPGVGAKGASIDPLRMLCDGTYSYERMLDHGTPVFSLREVHDTTYMLYNARLLGLPRYPGAQLDVGPALMSGKSTVQHASRRSASGELMVTLSATDCDSPGVRLLELTIDPLKDWSVTAFDSTIIAPAGTVYHVRSQARVEQFDGVWFPSWVRVEQYRGDELQWSQEIFVDDAIFNSELPKDAFTLEGLGALNGTWVFSRVPGIASWTVESDRIGPRTCEEHQADAKELAQPGGMTMPAK